VIAMVVVGIIVYTAALYLAQRELVHEIKGLIVDRFRGRSS
jgi:hypothetical protein